MVVKYLLEEFPIESSPKDALEVVAEIVLDKGWVQHRSFALEKAETWKGRVLKKLRTELSQLERQGKPARICFNSADAEKIQGACFVEPNDSSDIRVQKERRLQVSSYQKIVERLNPDEFELLCRKFIEIIGVKDAFVTRSTTDDGIDFYGLLEGESIFFPKDLKPTIQKQLSIWLVGQAKQYIKTQAGTPEIRDLVGSVALGRSGVVSTEKSPFPNLSIRISDPVFTILVTGGSLSSRAWKLLNRSGVVGVDGELLAAFLADRAAGPEGGLDEEGFREWLKEDVLV